MIKTFEQFINENYNEIKTAAIDGEYGAPLFNEIMESLESEIYNSINEGKITIDANMIEEGFFDTVGTLFKKGADKMGNKVEDSNTDAEFLKQSLKDTIDWEDTTGKDIEWYGKNIRRAEIKEKVFSKIEELCKSAEEICAKLSEKEENAYKTISEKMTAANEAIKEFTEKSIAQIKEIAELSKNKVSDIISAVVLFCQKMGEIAKNAIVALGKGVALAFSLPFVFAFSVYKGAVKVCEMLVEKVKDGAKVLKNVFANIKSAIVNWVVEMIKKAKETLKSACDSVKDGAKKAYDAVGKAYLAIVATLGQLASDAKDKISEAYNTFVDGVKDFADEVKSYVSAKWDIVSNWCKKTATAFSDGVQNVWKSMKDKVKQTVDSVKDAYKTLKDNADATWEEVVEWTDEKQQEMLKAKIKYAIDKWGKDTVASWIDEIK